MRLAFRSIVLVLGLGSVVAIGCYTGPGVDTNRLPDRRVETEGVDPAGNPREPADASTYTPRGLPCDVAAVVATGCIGCHGAVPSGGAQNRLLTYEDFAAKASNPAFKSVADLSLARMKSASRPMPPAGRLEQESIAIFERWVARGRERGTCAEQPVDRDPKGDGGVDEQDGGQGEAPVSICNADVVARPGEYSELMKPGNKCIACHSVEDGPPFEIAGTVYPTLHEPPDCRGVAAATVVIIDAAGTVHTLKTNRAGNFFLDETLARPYRALVVRRGNVREMMTPQTNGDCNTCHSEWGNGAPGRINIP